MEKLIKLNNHVDTLISAFRNSQAEVTQLRKELEESRSIEQNKQHQINSLESICEEKDYRIIALQDDIAKKDAQLEELITKIEEVLSSLPQPEQNFNQ